MEQRARALENNTMRNNLNSNNNNEKDLDNDEDTFSGKEIQRSPIGNLKLPSSVKNIDDATPASFGTFAEDINKNSSIKSVNFDLESLMEERFSRLRSDLFGEVENQHKVLTNIVSSQSKMEFLFEKLNDDITGANHTGNHAKGL